MPHIACNIVPRQIVELGDPTRRAADACESYGAVCKKTIKHLTCRRRHSATQLFGHRSTDGKKLWVQTFKRGYIEQSFRRLAVRSELLHGKANVRYGQRTDYALKEKGRVVKEKVKGASSSLNIKEAMAVPWVWSEEAARALWL